MKYSTMINGYTELNLTKLDVLDGFEEIKIATGYKLDGAEVQGFPGKPFALLPVPEPR
jgi:adenylosuccinate synthase